jgi:medium-chain acyl-[acyl-carrier-protein] hydrolase
MAQGRYISFFMTASMINSFKHGSVAGLPWLPKVRSKAGSKLRLFCFPYAGGASYTYSSWDSLLPQEIEVCPVELSGRASRMREPAARNIRSLVHSMTAALLPWLDRPFAFYGHSMGALISFELARELRRSHQLQPVHMFVSSCLPPHSPRRREKVTYNLPEPQFIAALRHFNGIPNEVQEHSEELMQLAMPLLRADFEACQTYEYIAGQVLECPLTVVGGLKDKGLNQGDLEEWREHTTSACTVRMVSGDHLFINTSQTWILRLLAEQLSEYTR